MIQNGLGSQRSAIKTSQIARDSSDRQTSAFIFTPAFLMAGPFRGGQTTTPIVPTQHEQEATWLGKMESVCHPEPLDSPKAGKAALGKFMTAA